jgi:hypothetical protein
MGLEEGWERERQEAAQRLLVENDQMLLSVGQLSDTDRVAPDHLGG